MTFNIENYKYEVFFEYETIIQAREHLNILLEHFDACYYENLKQFWKFKENDRSLYALDKIIMTETTDVGFYCKYEPHNQDYQHKMVYKFKTIEEQFYAKLCL